MKSAKKNWVFECLVEGDNDLVGLVAYAFYKKSKHDLATQLRKNNTPEEEIQEQVQSHHDSVVRSQQILDGFRNQAKTLLTVVHSNIANDVTTRLEREHARKVDELEKKKKKAFDDAVRQLKNSAKTYEQASWWRRSAKWLWNGFSGVFAAVITTVIVGGILFSIATEDEKKQMTEKTVKSVVEQLSGN
ncbi:hypothetical protein MHM95_09605 [Pseudoalteromonas sp. CnMc7-15]|uniref:hypothetical protein n=1 Tax=unclassified Pseudoalteromonas TaxID=194690 RepID=UPI001EF6B99D|nr:hypothetical protein [Pseudoalteromonas sp. CnMc7-15]MCG7566545.1 hypothetical protein [Pseudoalteromonas sp. CnMc7-15]